MLCYLLLIRSHVYCMWNFSLMNRKVLLPPLNAGCDLVFLIVPVFREFHSRFLYDVTDS